MIELTTALATLKTLTSVVREAGKVEITQQVIELQQVLLALLAENAELTAQKSALVRRLEELTALLEVRETFEFDRNAYWRVQEDRRDGPFCSRCFDAENKSVRLTQNTENVGVCPNCKHSVRLDGPRTPRPLVQRRVVHPGWVRDW